MASGKVKWYNSRKGYGFISPDDGSKDVFVHITALSESGISYLDEGDLVTFEIIEDKGKIKATKLQKTQT